MLIRHHAAESCPGPVLLDRFPVRSDPVFGPRGAAPAVSGLQAALQAPQGPGVLRHVQRVRLLRLPEGPGAAGPVLPGHGSL